MDKKSILSLIKNGESQTLEFKTSFQKEVIETIVAFANTSGGRILIGVKNNGTISGITITAETLKDWTNQIKSNTQPSLIPDIEEVKIDNKVIAVLSVQEQPVKPAAFKNRYFKRVKNSNHQLSLDEIANEHLKMISSSWDYQIDNRHNFDDISMDKVIALIDRISKFRGRPFDDDPLTILRKYELIKGEKLTFGAYLLFVDNFSAVTSFQIGRFKSETHIIDSKDLNTDVISQVDNAFEFIRKHLMVEYVMSGDIQREERYDYPVEAIREILINMVVHRDYRDSGNSIVRIFDDRIDFFNPGKLFGGLTIDNLFSGNYSSRTRNGALARIFKECGLVERYGSGITRILNECKFYGLSKPVFEEFAEGFKVTLFKTRVNEGVKLLYEKIKHYPGNRVYFFAEQLKTSNKNVERWIKQLSGKS